MRGIKAKILRKEALFLVGELPTVYVEKVVKKERVLTHRLDTNGNIITISYNGEIIPEFYILDKVTRYLGDCARRAYKDIKNSYKVSHESLLLRTSR